MSLNVKNRVDKQTSYFGSEFDPYCLLLYVQVVVTNFIYVAYYTNWVTTSWTHSMCAVHLMFYFYNKNYLKYYSSKYRYKTENI